MTKAGPSLRSTSKRAKPTEAAAGGCDRTNFSNGPSLIVKPPPPCGDLGRRLHSDEIVIGLALGSPGQSPLPPLPADDRDVDVCQKFDVAYATNALGNVTGELGTITEIGSGEQCVKRKGSKWKTFGSFFGRKDSATRTFEASPYCQVDRKPELGSSQQHNAQHQSEEIALRRKRADSTRSNRTRTDSSNSTSKGHSSGLLRKSSSRKNVLRRERAEEINDEMLRLHNALSTHAEAEDLHTSALITSRAPRRPVGSLLQVEIPNVELERYSVMFGDLLDVKPQLKTQPSLLTRRQGQVDELQAFSAYEAPNLYSPDDLPKAPHIRPESASSRSVKSPSFSLFPPSISTVRQSANTPSKNLSKPSPLSRSTTAPNILAPPDRPQIHKSKSQDEDHVFVILHSPANFPSTPSSIGRRRSFDVPQLSANSTQASFSECPEFLTSPYPTVEIDPPTPTTKSAREAFFKRAFPARKSSLKKLPLSLEQPDLPSNVRSDSVSTTAEVSIARQISISRRQRQLLIPIAPKLTRQPRQPKLVNGISTPQARKSHHLTLDCD